MTSRERVAEALAHRETDRVPIDLGGSIVTGQNAVGYRKLKSCVGLDGPVKVCNVTLLLAEIERYFLDRFKVDVLPINRYQAAPGVPVDGRWQEHALPDGNTALFPRSFSPVINEDGSWDLYDRGILDSHLSPGSSSFVPASRPLEKADLEELERFEPSPISYRELDSLHRVARELYEKTDYALFGWFNGSIFEQSQFLCGWDGFMMRLAGEPEFAEVLLRKLADRVLGDLEGYLGAVGDYIQVVGFGDDFGFQGGPQLSPGLFRTMVKPLLREIYAKAHSLSGAKVFLHSCGSVQVFIEDFIEIGVDILNPVQTSARAMAPEDLKREFGERIVFWGGGADARSILPQGTPAEVRQDVRRRLKIFSEGGGYVFAPIHNLQPDIPPENILAMYDEAAAWRRGS